MDTLTLDVRSMPYIPYLRDSEGYSTHYITGRCKHCIDGVLVQYESLDDGSMIWMCDYEVWK